MGLESREREEIKIAINTHQLPQFQRNPFASTHDTHQKRAVSRDAE